MNAFISHLLEMTTHILLHKRRSIQHGGTHVTCNWLSIKLQECEKRCLVVISTRTVFLYSLKSHTGKLSSPISTLSWNSCYTHITLLSTSPALPQLTKSPVRSGTYCSRAFRLEDEPFTAVQILRWKNIHGCHQRQMMQTEGSRIWDHFISTETQS